MLDRLNIILNKALVLRRILVKSEEIEHLDRLSEYFKRGTFLLAVVLVAHNSLLAQKITYVGYGKRETTPPHKVAGKVFDEGTGKPIPDASIYIKRQEIGINSDLDGTYSLELYPGLYELQISAIGYRTTKKKINVFGSGFVNLPLQEKIYELEEVVLAFNRNTPTTSNELGTERLEISAIKSLPRIGGELNIMNSLTLLPGVSSQGEASGGINIRGGTSDQNLILLGGATLYNPYHLFGFFSGFNSSIVRDVVLHKGVVPANFGGRASGIVDVHYKKGNFRNWESTLSLGSTASKFTTAGPIIKEKVAMTVAGRIAYPSWLLGYTRDPMVANSTASFYDHNLVVDYAISDRSSMEYSHYFSGDNFQFPDEIRNEWYNQAHVIKWAYDISENLFFDMSLTRSEYTSKLIDTTPFLSFEIKREISHADLSANLQVSFNEENTLKVGGIFKTRKNAPGEKRPLENSVILPESIEEEQAYESGVYFKHEIELTNTISLNYGLRTSFYSYRGPKTINSYDSRLPLSTRSIINSERIENGSIKNYHGWEPRIGLKYQLLPTFSIKGGYSRQYQYIHQLTNTTTIAPTDQWKLSDSFVKPQISTQYSLGLFKKFRRTRMQASIQGFYREFDNLLEYKDGADIAFKQNIETELTNAEGKAYGLELLLEKVSGKNFGWISYTYARSIRRTKGYFDIENINDGQEYPSNFDQPNTVSLVFNRRLGQKVILSSVFNFSTGRPFTLPEGKFLYNGTELAFYNLRNSVRSPDTHRLDVSLQFAFNTNKKIWSGDWTFSIYNIYGRKNPFSVFFQDFPGSSPQAYQLSIVGAPFPSLSYEVKF